MGNILELTDETYSSFIESTDTVVFIDFYSISCGPCQTLLTQLPSIAKYYENEDVVIAKVNAANNPKLSKKFMVRSVPLTVIIGKDKMVKQADIGSLSVDKYYKMIDRELGKNKGFFSRFLNSP